MRSGRNDRWRGHLRTLSPGQKAFFSQPFLCLSRACLGKMIAFSSKTGSGPLSLPRAHATTASPALPCPLPVPPFRSVAQRGAAPRWFCSRVLFGLELAPTATSTCCLIACPALPSLINLPRVSAACVCTTVARMRLDQRLHPSVRSGPQVCVPSPTPSHHCIVLSVPCSTTTVSISIYRLHLDPHDGAF